MRLSWDVLAYWGKIGWRGFKSESTDMLALHGIGILGEYIRAGIRDWVNASIFWVIHYFALRKVEAL